MSIRKLTNKDWNQFDNDLQNEYNRCENLFNEDLVRYVFVQSYSKMNAIKTVKRARIEVPYRKDPGIGTPLRVNQSVINPDELNRCRADLYYESDDEVIELKFHRRSIYSGNCTSSKLGSVLNDFNRLSVLKNDGKYSIYVGDEQMKEYFKKHQSTSYPMFDFDNIAVGDIFKLKDHSGEKGFGEILKRAFNSFDERRGLDITQFGYKVKVLHKAKINGNMVDKNLYLYVFEILI